MKSINSSILKFILNKQNFHVQLIAIFILILFLTVSFLLSSLIKPLLLALFFSYALNPIVQKLENFKIPSSLAIVITLLAILSIITLVGFLFYLNIQTFLQAKMKIYEHQFNLLYENITKQLIQLKIIQPDTPFLELFDLNEVLSQGKDYLFSVYKSTSDFLGNFFLFILFLCLLLPGIRNFRIKTNRSFDKKKADKLNFINDRIVKQIQQYIVTKAFISLLTGLSVYLISTFFGLDLALVWGVLAFILNFIPSIGSLIASIFPIFFSLLQFGFAIETGLIAILIILIQFVFGNIVEPKLFSKSMSLSTLVVFLSLFFFGYIWGIIGALLSVPIMATISIICQNIPALKPISHYLQSTFPIKEDEERLSLIYHVVYVDNELQDEEKKQIKEELKKEIYNPLSINKFWNKIEKKPLKLNKIFEDKEEDEKLNLYYLACKIALLDNKINQPETDLLLTIQKKYGQLSPAATSNIHKLLYLEKIIDDPNMLKIDYESSDEYEEEQLAYTYMLLGKKYLELNQKDMAYQSYFKAIEYYLITDNEGQIKECAQKIALIEPFLKEEKNSIFNFLTRN